MSTTYYEDRLPKGQSPIETSNVKRLLTCTYYLTDPGNPYSTIAVVTAPAGAGKTIAAGFCQQAVERRFSSALPATLKVKVMPRSTSGVLATHVLENLGERVRGDNSAQLTAAAARGIERNDTRLVIFDEGDRLNDDSFEVVRYLQDKTGCPILVVGLPRISSVIERQEKFNSRVGLRMSFEPLSLQEMINVVLPQLIFPLWSFDPHNDNDRAMGEELWKRVGPSLRKLRNVLTIASKTAVAKGADTITLPLITEAFSWVISQEDKYQERNRSANSSGEQPGSHEERSRQRHEAREAKGKKKTDA
jgi:DNA transposition AAA+ family ATPase